MPEQNPLPFPAPATDDPATPAPADSGGATPAGGPPRQRIAPRPVAARRPLWARLLGWVVGPWLDLKLEPAQQPQDDPRPVCYVLEDYGLSNALILDKACRQ